MKYSEYKQLNKIVRNCTSRRDLRKTAEANGFGHVSEETLISIYTLELQSLLKRSFGVHNREDRRTKYYETFFERVQKGEQNVVLNMAAEFDLSPCMLMRFILDLYMEQKNKALSQNMRARAITNLFKHPENIAQPDLALAAKQATLKDDIFGPFPDRIRRALGVQFEVCLKNWCKENDIGYLSEDDMRKKGYDKTPDIKLTVPIAVDGFVVNWIESKAAFGNVEWHTKNVQDQIGPYIHRFGPGLVIYWFGFVDELNCQKENGIALGDGLPKRVDTFDEKLWDKHPEWKIPKPSLW